MFTQKTVVITVQRFFERKLFITFGNFLANQNGAIVSRLIVSFKYVCDDSIKKVSRQKYYTLEEEIRWKVFAKNK